MITQEIEVGKTIERTVYGDMLLTYTDPGHMYRINGRRTKGVTTIVGVLDKPGLVNWAVNQACDFMQQNCKALDEVSFIELIRTARKAHDASRDKAADYGTAAHDWLQSWIEADIARANKTDQTYFKLEPMGRLNYGYPNLPENKHLLYTVSAALDWIRDNGVSFEATEQIVYSKMFGYAGKFDWIGRIRSLENKRVLADWKTSNSLSKSHAIQAAGYRVAIEEETGADSFDGCVLVKIPKYNEELDVKVLMDTKEKYDLYKNVFKMCAHIYNALSIINKDFPYVKK
jgi:hypothetical protein